MDDLRVGAAFRAVRLRRGWRQADVAARGGVSRAFVSLVERGHLDRVSLATLRRLGGVLDIRIDVVARWRGGALDRMLNARHSQFADAVVADVPAWGRWDVLPEVSFSIYGERGIIDLLAFHAPSGCLLVIELKTEIVDVNEMIGTHDRKARLAATIARDRGWEARSVSRWVIVSRTSANLRRIQAHRSVLRAAYPDDGRTMRAWLHDPSGRVSALSTWSHATPGSARPTARRPGAADRGHGQRG